MQQDISMIICDKREKMAELSWLINSYTIVYVKSGERKTEKKKKKSLSPTPYYSPTILYPGKVFLLEVRVG